MAMADDCSSLDGMKTRRCWVRCDVVGRRLAARPGVLDGRAVRIVGDFRSEKPTCGDPFDAREESPQQAVLLTYRTLTTGVT